MVCEVFGDVYSQAYDVLYDDKDYEAECDFVEEIFKRASVGVHTILDLGCGTGGHALPLARRGYQVSGVDRSDEMLEIAAAKARDSGVDLELVHGDLRDLDLGRTFDAVISMFAVMSYQTTNDDLAAACRTAARHLAPGGVFAFDAWHGAGVLTDPPTSRTRTVDDGCRRIVRFTSPAVDITTHTARITFTVRTLLGNELVSQTTETHLMRFVFPQEIGYFLEVAGFRETQFCPFMQIDRPLDTSCWNIAVSALKGQA